MRPVYTPGSIREYKGYYIHCVEASWGRRYHEVGEAPSDFEEYYGLPHFDSLISAQNHIKSLIRAKKEEEERQRRAKEATEALKKAGLI